MSFQAYTARGGVSGRFFMRKYSLSLAIPLYSC